MNCYFNAQHEIFSLPETLMASVLAAPTMAAFCTEVLFVKREVTDGRARRKKLLDSRDATRPGREFHPSSSRDVMSFTRPPA